MIDRDRLFRQLEFASFAQRGQIAAELAALAAADDVDALLDGLDHPQPGVRLGVLEVVRCARHRAAAARRAFSTSSGMIRPMEWPASSKPSTIVPPSLLANATKVSASAVGSGSGIKASSWDEARTAAIIAYADCGSSCVMRNPSLFSGLDT